MTEETDRDLERLPADVLMDETAISLRAYLSGLSDDHLARYDPASAEVVSATEVDHIVPRRVRPELEFSLENLQGLCKR